MIICDKGDHKPANIDVRIEPCQLCEMFDYHIGRAMELILQAPHEGHAAEDYVKAKWHLGREAMEMDSDDIITPTVKPLGSYGLFIIAAYAAHNDLIETLFSDVGHGCIDYDSIARTADKLATNIELLKVFDDELHQAEFETIERVKRE